MGADDPRPLTRRRIAVRRSPVHGRGVFAVRDLAAGELVLHFGGEVVDWDEVVHRYPDTDGHTFLYDLADGRVIDGGRGGNSARWINHSCEPNCEAVRDGARIAIHARSAIRAGSELFLDYQLDVPEPQPIPERYACRCGTPGCRGTMLAT